MNTAGERIPRAGQSSGVPVLARRSRRAGIQTTMATSALPSEYDLFASIYSAHWGKEFSARVLPALDDLVLRRLPPGARVLDLCCGAGHVLAALVERGFRVTGLDSSAEMVRLARQNAPGAEAVEGDARSFQLPEPVDAALSTFNSLAHIPSLEEMARVFRCVHSALAPGAPFLFDLSTEEAYATHWRGSFGIVAEEHACIVRPSYDPERRVGRNDITIFHRDGQWRRVDLVITQRCYSEEELRGALSAAGFADIRTFDGERDIGLQGDAGRIFFLAFNNSS
jgi:SAM-dependent methyltransferase